MIEAPESCTTGKQATPLNAVKASKVSSNWVLTFCTPEVLAKSDPALTVVLTDSVIQPSGADSGTSVAGLD